MAISTTTVFVLLFPCCIFVGFLLLRSVQCSNDYNHLLHTCLNLFSSGDTGKEPTNDTLSNYNCFWGLTEPPHARSIIKYGACELHPYDPWNPEARMYQDLSKHKKCSITRLKHTELNDGVLRISNESVDYCDYRCLNPKGDNDIQKGAWLRMNAVEGYKPDCDFVETQCIKEKTTISRYIHIQVKMPKNKLFQAEDDLHPSVLVLVFSEASSASGIRTLPETSQVLRQYYDATTFYYHNKVGENSRPNAHGFLIGERISDMTPNERLFPNGGHLAEVPDSCEKPVNKNRTIVFNFLSQCYATSIFESQKAYSLKWPNCTAFSEVPVDHWGTTYVLRAEGKDKSNLSHFLFEGECEEMHNKMLEYNAKFQKTYSGLAKFSYIWSDIAHDELNALVRADKAIADFFRANVQYLKKSFIFVTSDSGFRMGPFRQTKFGDYEDNNPMLMVAVPESLRLEDQLMTNLRRNSKMHTSHYDLYATLYDIAHYARKRYFRNWVYHDFRQELGEIRGGRAKSLLRPIVYDRTCEEMNIHSSYCMCNQTWRQVDLKSNEAMVASRALVNLINNYLAKKKMSDRCAVLTVHKTLTILKSGDGAFLKLALVTSPPNDGFFEAVLAVKNEAYEISTIGRIDPYEHEGDCASEEDIRPFCFCYKNWTTSAVLKQ